MITNMVKLNQGLFKAVDKRRLAALSPTISIIILEVIVSLILASGFG
jgi:hypothetical protein